MKWQWLNAASWWVGGLLIIGATVAVLAAIGLAKYRQIQTAMAAPPPPEAPVAVGLATAEAIKFRQTSVVVGTVLAPRFIQLRTELPGIVTAVSMEPGQVVPKDQVLVQLDVRSEAAELKSAMADLKFAEAEVNRIRSIASPNAISAQEKERAEANLSRAEAEVDRLSVMIDRKTIRAPFEARVGLHQLHIGQYLEAGAPITSLEGTDPFFEIDFSVPKHIAESLKIGDRVRLNLGTNSAAVTPSVIEVPVVALDGRADAISRTMLVRARIDNPPATMRPNDSVRVVVEYGDLISAVAVPATAVRSAPTGRSVFLAVEREGALRAEVRNVVVIGTGDGTRAWIGAGLAGGEQVVAEGSFKVRDGALLAPVALERVGSTPSLDHLDQSSLPESP
jgi:membrane fusion protein, multidrug efflux system